MGLVFPAVVSAQSSDAASSGGEVFALEEILVTAQKRAESIQDVPLAITAFSGDFTRDVNLSDVKDIVSFAPGVTGNSDDSFIDSISIRGILTNDFGVGGDPSISFFKNGLYQGRNGSVVTSLFDIERAEVLRGPQGFLFGRASVGGAISVHTTKPNLNGSGGYIDLDVGERGLVVGEGAFNLPVSDKFAIRVAGIAGQENGYLPNKAQPNADPLMGFDKYAARLSALYKNETVEVLFTAEYEKRDQSGSIYVATELDEGYATLTDLFGVDLASNGRTINSDLAIGNRDDARVWSFGLQVDVDLDGATFTSLTGYKSHTYSYAEDFDGTPLAINGYGQDQDGKYFEQELRIVSDTDDPLSWYAGVSFYDENIDAQFAQQGGEEVMCAYYLSAYGFDNCSAYIAYYGGEFTPNPDGLLERNDTRGRYHGWAAYVDLNYAINDQFDVGVGLRYTKDIKDFSVSILPVESDLGPFFAFGYTTDGFLQDKASWGALSPRFIARYRPSDDVTVFASITRGFKAGGYGSFSISPDLLGELGITSADAGPDKFDPEKAWSYEIGTKVKVLNGRGLVDLNAYYYTYNDLQVTIPGNGGGIVVSNVGNVKGWGLEGSAKLDVNEYFELLVSGAYADSKVKNAQAICDGEDVCEGSGLPHIPQFSGSAVAKVHYGLENGEVFASGEIFGQSEIFGGQKHLAEGRMAGYADITLRLGYAAHAGWSVTGYVENLTNKLYYKGVAEGSGIIPAHYFGVSRPRTFGVRLSYRFGE